jgi:hypothetical protein
VFAGWGFSQAFLRQRLDMEAMGYGSLEDFITQFWEGDSLKKGREQYFVDDVELAVRRYFRGSAL